MGADAEHAVVKAIFDDAIAVYSRVREMDHGAVVAAAAAIRATLAAGGRLLIFGNGGSAADAQHMAAELVGRFSRERRAVAALALTTDSSVMTSVANDYGFERIFARQIEALGRPGDVAFGILVSGANAPDSARARPAWPAQARSPPASEPRRRRACPSG